MNNKSFKPKGGSEGFTLIELLVAAALLVILASGFVGIQYILSQNQTSAWKSYLSIESANGVLTNIVNEIRNSQPSETGSYQLVMAGDQEIIFYSDLDHDGVSERIRYTLNGSDLTRGIVEPSGTPLTYNLSNESVKTVSNIVRNSTSPLFYYYNSDWPNDTVNNPLETTVRISDTSQIRIVLTINEKDNDQANNYLLESYAKIRTINK